MGKRVELGWISGPGDQDRRQGPSSLPYDNDFSDRYPGIVKALVPMPDEQRSTARWWHSTPTADHLLIQLQNHSSSGVPLHFFILDVLVLKGKDAIGKPSLERRELIEKHILPKLADPIRYSPILQGAVKI